MAANMVVRTNVFSLNSHRNMKNTGLEMRRASNRLASGYRINSAADDAAGLAISENMRAQIRGLDQASRNTQDGQAMLLVTEGGLQEIGNMLQRTRELLVQASNDTNTQEQRWMIEQEISQLATEIDGMQQRVEFNTNRVLAAGMPDVAALRTDAAAAVASTETRFGNLVAFLESSLAAQAARIVAGDTFDADIVTNATLAAALGATGVGNTAVSTALFGVDLHATASSANQNAMATALGRPDLVIATAENVGPGVYTDGELAALNTARLASLNTLRADTAAYLATLGTEIGNAVSAANIGDLATALTDINTAITNIMAVDGLVFAGGLGPIDMNEVNALFEVDSSGDHVAWFQVGANSNQEITFDFELVSTVVAASGALVHAIADLVADPATGTGIGHGQDISPLIDVVNTALDNVNMVRANLGAVMNRMDYTMRSLDISSENLSDAESRVRNADMAREMMRFTQTQVLAQAATAMLAQANQIPNNLLQLLR